MGGCTVADGWEDVQVGNFEFHEPRKVWVRFEHRAGTRARHWPSVEVQKPDRLKATNRGQVPGLRRAR
ncbi:MAG: hypothetical protein B7C54_00295 [Acidimicrobiales bacterium mtb01]|nr:MAG: hypothetical protein B7C54_00295 [Acidimicrobiales bacterium mtb01]